MALKGQLKLEIDWDVVRDALGIAWRSRGTKGFPNLTTTEAMRLVKKHSDCENYAQWLVSIRYALDESFVIKFKFEDEKVARLDGLTIKGYELLNMLDNEWVWEKIRDLATENSVSLTADIIIEAGRRLSLRKMGLE